MRVDTVRRFTSVHTWTGLIAGWGLFIAFFSGALTMFYYELHAWSAHETRGVALDSPARVEALVRKVVAEHPRVATELQVSLNQSPRAIAYWRKADSEDYEMTELVGDQLVTPNARRFTLPDFIYQIHYSLGLPATFGMYLLGLACVVYGLALVSGVVIHAPHLLTDLFALRLGRNLKRLWQDAHNVIGVLSLPFHIVFAYTGAMFTILALLTAGMNYLALRGHGEQLLQQATSVIPIRAASGEPAQTISVADVIAAAGRAEPAFHTTFLSFHHYGDSAGTIEVYGELPGRFIESGRLVFSASTGELLGRAIGTDAHAGLVATGVMFALHFGSFGGPAIQWMYFLLGLAGAFLFYSGNLLWIESRRRRRDPEQSRTTVVMARLTVGICIGCCLAVACMFVANKLPMPAFGVAEYWDRTVYTTVFLASVGYALCRQPARGAIDLLVASSLMTLLIPLANALASGDHLVKSALRADWALFGVDATALVMGAGFVVLACAVRRRARAGDANSVWSLERREDRDALPANAAGQ
jgi:uncharacterized iron-regulated membrane protein